MTSNAFKITLPNMNCVYHDTFAATADASTVKKSVAKEERENTVLALCRKNGSVSRKDVQETLQISQSTAILLLKKMVGEGTLVIKGSGKEVRYAVK